MIQDTINNRNTHKENMRKELFTFIESNSDKDINTIAEEIHLNFEDDFYATTRTQDINKEDNWRSSFFYEILNITQSWEAHPIYLWRMVKVDEKWNTVLVDTSFFPMYKEEYVYEGFRDIPPSSMETNTITSELIMKLNELLVDNNNALDIRAAIKILDIIGYFNAIYNMHVSYIGQKNFNDDTDAFVEVFQIEGKHSLFPKPVFVWLEYKWNDEAKKFLPKNKFKLLTRVINRKAFLVKE